MEDAQEEGPCLDLVWARADKPQSPHLEDGMGPPDRQGCGATKGYGEARGAG